LATLTGTQTLTNKTINGANNTLTDVSLTTAVTGTLPVANGGTGATSLTTNNVLLGNGTSALQAVAPGTTGNVLTSNGTTWQSSTPSAPVVSTPVVERTSNTIFGTADAGKLFVYTSGTFTQTFTAASTLGNGWTVEIRNSGTGVITLDPNASETIDGRTTIRVYPGESFLVVCNGTLFYTVGRAEIVSISSTLTSVSAFSITAPITDTEIVRTELALQGNTFSTFNLPQVKITTSNFATISGARSAVTGTNTTNLFTTNNQLELTVEIAQNDHTDPRVINLVLSNMSGAPRFSGSTYRQSESGRQTLFSGQITNFVSSVSIGFTNSSTVTGVSVLTYYR
jgi:hypothetical protein